MFLRVGLEGSGFRSGEVPAGHLLGIHHCLVCPTDSVKSINALPIMRVRHSEAIFCLVNLTSAFLSLPAFDNGIPAFDCDYRSLVSLRPLFQRHPAHLPARDSRGAQTRVLRSVAARTETAYLRFVHIFRYGRTRTPGLLCCAPPHWQILARARPETLFCPSSAIHGVA